MDGDVGAVRKPFRRRCLRHWADHRLALMALKGRSCRLRRDAAGVHSRASRRSRTPGQRRQRHLHHAVVRVVFRFAPGDAAFAAIPGYSTRRLRRVGGVQCDREAKDRRGPPGHPGHAATPVFCLPQYPVPNPSPFPPLPCHTNHTPNRILRFLLRQGLPCSILCPASSWRTRETRPL